MLPLWIVSALSYATRAVSSAAGQHDPLVRTKNGTLRGLSLPAFGEELFLGVPFAEPPLGNLRLRHPVPYRSAWDGVRDATSRSVSCAGYAGFDQGLALGEDCLTVDIVRPAGAAAGDGLPVLVWIYGGGFTAGGSADPRYNTSYLVNASVEMGKPIIAVSLNYRVGGWGFLASRETVSAGASNIGLFDQRLALEWIHENIAAFGGDPSRVTIAGESAGAFSVGYHLVSRDGKSGGLFRAAILQSGTALGPALHSVADLDDTYQPIYDNVTRAVGCAGRDDSLQCLRDVPYEVLFRAFEPFVLTPIVDGDFLARLPSESFARGLVADVAILAGSNTDEGTATFFGPRGTLNRDADVRRLLAGMGSGLDDAAVRDLMRLYPDNPSLGCPFGTGPERFAENGRQYKRGAAIVGDEVIHAGRRWTTTYFATRHLGPGGRRRKPVYSYRFDQPPWDGVEPLVATTAPVFATHYAEICFVFAIDPAASRNLSNWIGPYPAYHQLARQMSRAWIAFVHDLDPNGHGTEGMPRWPEYSSCGAGENMVFRVDGNFVEKDDWRAAPLRYWGGIWEALKT
ncbi:hypothetical protein VTK73DRAFT_7112 [Phialemonium thermophilum]|uniref:Carboxylic ester hydrolase n=1 Tax=Phialemonium thermophilum TaxID=223376 RepID=A0ABR3WGE0_9PEZI